MLERTDIQRVVALPTVRVNDAIWSYLALDDRRECRSLRVWDYPRIHLSTALQESKYWDFARSATPTFPFALAAEVTFIYFNLTAEHRFALNLQFVCDDLAKSVEIERG